MKRLYSLIVSVMLLGVYAAADSGEYVDIDALMKEVQKPIYTPHKTRKSSTVETKREGAWKSMRHTPSQKHQKPRRYENTSRYARRSPEHYVRRHYGPNWRRHRLGALSYRMHRAYARPKRGWVLAYVYDHADFYDRYGFHYGDFDRRGFMFEGRWFRYNARYSYRDRLRGRGYFDRYYYVPHHARRYGFCAP